MKDETLGQDIAAISLLHGTFQLRSGQTSTEYFDKYRFESDPSLLKRLASRMLELLQENVDVLAGLELGGVPIATAMSLASGIPAVFIRKSAKTYGTCQAIEGRDVAGLKVAIVEDVITTGGAVREAAALLLQQRAMLAGVVCAIWRGDGVPRVVDYPDIQVAAALRCNPASGTWALQDRSG